MLEMDHPPKIAEWLAVAFPEYVSPCTPSPPPETMPAATELSCVYDHAPALFGSIRIGSAKTSNNKNRYRIVFCFIKCNPLLMLCDITVISLAFTETPP